MQHNSAWIHFGGRSCTGCGSLWPGRVGLCESCEVRIFARFGAKQKVLGGIQHRYLVDWNPDESDLLSRWILSLKGPHQSDSWKEIAHRFIEHHGDAFPNLLGRTLVTAPSSQKTRHDHSSIFASHLEASLGLRCVGRPLVKNTTKKSRRLEIWERFDRQDLVTVKGFHCPDPSRVILVDDVLTTGSTAFAVRHALTAEKGMEVWTLARRGTSSCGASKPMLNN